MRALLTITICLCVCILPAFAAYVPLTIAYNSTPCSNSGVVGCPIGNIIDGSEATITQLSATGAWMGFTFPQNYSLTSCDVRTESTQTGLKPGFQTMTNPLTYTPSSGSTYMFPSAIPANSWSTFNFSPANNTNVLNFYNGGVGGWFTYAELRCTASDYFETMTADFNATPISGQAPLYVAFQDNSTGSPTSYNWSVSPDTGVIGEESTSAYPTMAFTLNGNYSVTHCISNTVLSDCETKTDYISVYNSTALATTTFWAVDPLGHRVWDSAISLQDVQNSSWTNASSPSGGSATITSLFGHTINGYATASGYNDGETLGITADGVSGGIILMTPTNITNVSAGHVTLYVYAKESVGNAPISGAYINLAYEEGGSTRNDGSTTNTEGVASFVVPNNTLIYVYGEKVGYERVSTTKDSGSGSGGDAAVSVILYMTGQYVTPTVTATTGPGGTVPVTVDPRTPQEKESDIALILIDYGDMLVMFFIALTVIGGVKMIMK